MLPVFNVTDQDGNKLRDEGMLDFIRKVDMVFYLYTFSLSFLLVAFSFTFPFFGRER